MAALPWRQWLDSGGSEGIEPPDDVKRAFEAAMAWMVEPQGTDRYRQLANEMIRLNVDNLRFFGTVGSPPLVRIATTGSATCAAGRLGDRHAEAAPVPLGNLVHQAVARVGA